MDLVRDFVKKYIFIFSLFFTFFIIALFHFTRLVGLKLYPVVVNFSIFFVFFSSLFSEETIIQKFARIAEGELKEPIKCYTKKLTYVWCVFLFVQFLLSIITCFLSDKIWMIYNGCLSYFFLGCFFAIEYIFRVIYKRKHGL